MDSLGRKIEKVSDHRVVSIMSYPRKSIDCSYCAEFREWNEKSLVAEKEERNTKRDEQFFYGKMRYNQDVVLPRCREYVEHCKRYHPDRKSIQYAFTLTTNRTKEEVEEEMLNSCRKLFLQQTCPIREGEAYLEYTEEGRPHIHGWYETEDGGRVFSKVFQRCWPAWKEKRGLTKFAGGYHEVLKSQRYKGYSSAEGRVVCVKKENEALVYNAPSEECSAQVVGSSWCEV